ncbi:MAG: glycosyltransferase [Alphaproteobacteria bacterium]|nr:glycosyltransferase [Alphaproteobacteria bacterium]
MRHVFILVPSMLSSGPIKGAIALANAMVNSRPVTMVALKCGQRIDDAIDPRVRQLSLADEKNFVQKIFAYWRFLDEAGGREKVSSISSCLSADALNFFCKGHAFICSSIRGNLLLNYRMDYGLFGTFCAVVHLIAQRRFDQVIAMNGAMAAQIKSFLGRTPEIIGNFVDEAPLEKYRGNGEISGPLQFIFLASLSSRKQPLVLIRAFAALLRKGVDARLDIVGDGPLNSVCRDELLRLGLADRVVMHGQLACPYQLLSQADALVLPSLSEGISRAAMEAMFLGVPCILRDVDGNAELIENSASGAIFKNDDELPDVMLKVAELSRARSGQRVSLLPENCRQFTVIERYLELIG